MGPGAPVDQQGALRRFVEPDGAPSGPGVVGEGAVAALVTDDGAGEAVAVGVFMSVNPVFAALNGLVVLGQSLGLAGWLAVAAIVTANVVSLGAAGRLAARASA